MKLQIDELENMLLKKRAFYLIFVMCFTLIDSMQLPMPILGSVSEILNRCWLLILDYIGDKSQMLALKMSRFKNVEVFKEKIAQKYRSMNPIQDSEFLSTKFPSDIFLLCNHLKRCIKQLEAQGFRASSSISC